MLSKVEKEMLNELKISVARLENEREILEKELAVIKEERKTLEREYQIRNSFVEGLLSHMLAKPIRIVHPDGAVEQRWQEVRSISGEQHYFPGKRF